VDAVTQAVEVAAKATQNAKKEEKKISLNPSGEALYPEPAPQAV